MSGRNIVNLRKIRQRTAAERKALAVTLSVWAIELDT